MKDIALHFDINPPDNYSLGAQKYGRKGKQPIENCDMKKQAIKTMNVDE